jgi:hypothetical protein
MFGRLFFDNEITNFLQVSSNNKISMIMLNGSQGAIIEVGNFIRRDRSKIDVVSFIPIKKIDFDADKLGWDDVDNLMIQSTNRINVKIGRFLRKFLSSQSIVDFGISDKDIEDFVNLFKSYFTPDKNKLQITDGVDILKWYLEDNYATTCGNRSGSLWKSCMRQSERNKYMVLYTKNISLVKMLIFLTDDGKLRARALLWENVVDKYGNSYKVMDRIYSIYDHDMFLFKGWAKENGYITKLEQSAKSEVLFDVNGQPTTLELRIKLNNWEMNDYPYLDTFKYFDLYGGWLSNTVNFRYQYKLVQCDGCVERQSEEEEYNEEEYDEGEDW